MKIIIIQGDGIVGVDGEFRQVELSELAGEIHAIHFDTAPGAGGVIEFDEGAVEERQVRDTAREDGEWAAARKAGTPEREIDVPVRYKTIPVPKSPVAITDFTPYEIYLERWRAAPPPPPNTEDAQRVALEEKRTAALRALDDERLAGALAREDAPDAVKQYAAELSAAPAGRRAL